MASLVRRNAQEIVEDVLLSVLVDMSGSMRQYAGITVPAYNNFLDDRREDPAIRYECAVFNDEYRSIAATTTHDAAHLYAAQYRPEGGTALYTAITQRIREIEQHATPPSDVLFVVFSDGEDSVGTDVDARRAKTAIGEKRELGWRFIFFAPNDATRRAARNLGFRDNDIAAYTTDATGISGAFRSLSRGTRRFIAAAEVFALPPGTLLD